MLSSQPQKLNMLINLSIGMAVIVILMMWKPSSRDGRHNHHECDADLHYEKEWHMQRDLNEYMDSIIELLLQGEIPLECAAQGYVDRFFISTRYTHAVETNFVTPSTTESAALSLIMRLCHEINHRNFPNDQAQAIRIRLIKDYRRSFGVYPTARKVFPLRHFVETLNDDIACMNAGENSPLILESWLYTLLNSLVTRSASTFASLLPTSHFASQHALLCRP